MIRGLICPLLQYLAERFSCVRGTITRFLTWAGLPPSSQVPMPLERSARIGLTSGLGAALQRRNSPPGGTTLTTPRHITFLTATAPFSGLVVFGALLTTERLFPFCLFRAFSAASVIALIRGFFQLRVPTGRTSCSLFALPARASLLRRRVALGGLRPPPLGIHLFFRGGFPPHRCFRSGSRLWHG